MRHELLAATALGTSLVFLVHSVAVAQSTAFDWSGTYIGGSVGVVNSTSRVDFTYSSSTSGPGSVALPAIGAAGSIAIGHNFQLDQFVIGIEADGTLMQLSGTATGPDYTIDHRLESLLTLRGRFGVASGPFMAYGTVGLAGGNASYSALVSDMGKDSPSAATASGFVMGVAGGGGVEYAVNDNVSVKGETLFYSLAPLNASGDTGKGSFDSAFHTNGLLVRTGVNVHF